MISVEQYEMRMEQIIELERERRNLWGRIEEMQVKLEALTNGQNDLVDRVTPLIVAAEALYKDPSLQIVAGCADIINEALSPSTFKLNRLFKSFEHYRDFMPAPKPQHTFPDSEWSGEQL